MKKSEDYKRVILPQGLKRAQIVEKSKEKRIDANDYERIVVNDFNENRAAYKTVFILGVPVKVKVERS